MTTRIRQLLFTTCLVAFSCIASAGQVQCSDPGSSLLWKVQGKNSTVHLFGSLHLGEPGFYPLPEKIELAFRNADHLVFELDPRSLIKPEVQVRMLQQGSLPPGESLRNQLSAEVIEDLESTLQDLGLPSENVMGFRPWFINMLLSSLQYASIGYVPEHGVEQYLTREVPASANILELETLDEQLEALQYLDGEAFLAHTLASFQESKAMAQELVMAWRCADHAALTALLHDSFDLEGPLAEDIATLKEKLFTERNRRMVATIDSYLKEGSGHYFVVIGSGHYLGDESIIDLLRQQGHTVAAVRL